MHARLTYLVLAVLVAGGASIPAAKNLSRENPGQQSTVAVSGMRAHVDPITGALVPEPPPGAGQPPLSPQLIPDDSKLEFIEQPDGTKGVLFHGQRQATMIATLDGDGSVQTKCIESTAALQTVPNPAEQKSHDD